MNRAMRHGLTEALTWHGNYLIAPLLRAAIAGELVFVHLAERDQMPDLHRLNQPRLPAIVLVGDDDYGTTGPAGWSCTDAVLGWARWALVHGSGGTVAEYEQAIAAARIHRRVAIIETASRAVDGWCLACGDAGVPDGLIRVPFAGGVHPVDHQPPRRRSR